MLSLIANISKFQVAFLSVSICMLTFFAPAQSPIGTKLERLTTEDGLSNDQVNFIYQDKQGYIWIGTLSGLNRYDGYQIKSYYRDDNDTTSIRSNTVIWMCAGPDDKIWVRSNAGISAFDPATGRFSTPSKYLEKLQTDNVFITKMLQDPFGRNWFIIENRGIVMFDIDKTVVEVSAGSNAGITIASNQISDIELDIYGNLWITHAQGLVEMISIESLKVSRKYGLPKELASRASFWNIYVDGSQDVWLYSLKDHFGLFHINPHTGNTNLYKYPEISSDIVTKVVQDDEGNIWIGADHGGVSILNKQTGAIKNILHDPDVSTSLLSNNINSLFKDKNGGMWISTTKSGVNYYHPSAGSFSHFKYDRKEPAYNDMSSFAQDAQGNLWIGTNGKGVLKFCTEKNEFKSLKGVHGPQPKVVVSMLIDSRGVLWIGTYLEGLFHFEGNRFSKLKVPGLDASNVWELFEDSHGNIWIGTLENGVYKYSPSDGNLTNYNMAKNVGANYVTSIREDRRGHIWLGTGNGLSRYDPATNEIRNFAHGGTDSKNAISNNSIISLHCDTEGNVWIGTLDGLNKLNTETMQFTVYNKRHGLPSNIIMSIQEDEDNNLWISTDHGIVKMTKGQNPSFHHYTISDGLQGENFTEDAGFTTRDGRLIFSGKNGFNIFNPANIETSKSTLEVLLTGISINNIPMVQGDELKGRTVLDKPIHQTDKLSLSHDENYIAIEFVALSFFQSRKIRYQYKLDGYDLDWINVPSETRKAIFANLDAGNYTFSIRASFDGQSWTSTNSLALEIKPPFWKTPLAFILYSLAIIFLLYLTRKYIVQRERHKAKVENERREVERQHQLDLMKIKFFTNISHEFRTPLSLVITPIERMVKYPEKVKAGDLAIVLRNARRLMTLVNQLLDFRKMEANQHTLSQSSGDIIAFLHDVVDSFSDWSKEKDIPVVFDSEVKSYYTFFDKDKMEKIMFNLLSNAFKFTMPGGKITVDFELQKSQEGNMAHIMVTDTGIGIPVEKQQLIFNRFFQNELNGDIINNGTGIGLSITKEFVELHKGTITVDSKPNMGSTFTVDIPLKEINTEEDVANQLVKELAESFDKPATGPAPSNANLPTVLLVEDNFDFRFYLKDNLKQYYNILVASNGKEAWKIILHDKPDIVISDVMMPVMDGLELCEKIKSDPRTLQLPVILLTAQSSDRHKIQGLEAGAIEYISKPFNFEILISSINSALKFQSRVKESGKKIQVSPSEVQIVSEDEQLIAKAVVLVEENMSNSEFSVEDLSHELGYSRGHFYQKILRLTGQTPIDFIRNIRMKRAVELLNKSQLNVSEVAYKVGYNNPKLFSRYFKSIYRVYPSELRGKNEKLSGEQDQ